jgi:hypothetical protein
MYITLKNRFLLECEQHYGVYSKKISSSDTHIIHSIFNMYTANRNLNVIEKLNSCSISYKDAYTYEFAILLFLKYH